MEIKKGQICTVSRKDWKLYDLTTKQVFNAQINNTFTAENLPVVGDYVDYCIDQWDNCFILNIDKRKNLLKRVTKSVDKSIAANIDVVFIVSSLNKDFEMEKMERFALIASVKNANIVFVLTKADLCKNKAKYTTPLQQRFKNAPIITLNTKNRKQVEQLFQFWGKNQTAIFLGSSGVGKSTLINSLVGKDAAKTFDVRQFDDQGRHTTTARNMYFLADNRIIIDTPGIRSIQSTQEKQVVDVFEKISEFASMCKYSNCQHKTEDGCAVLGALKSEQITEEEFAEFLKLEKSMQKQTSKGIAEIKRQSSIIKRKRIESKNKKLQKK